ncbi:hypothetical protein D3C81_1184730 [compost metagenome]
MLLDDQLNRGVGDGQHLRHRGSDISIGHLAEDGSRLRIDLRVAQAVELGHRGAEGLLSALGAIGQRAAGVDAHGLAIGADLQVVVSQADHIPVRQPGVGGEAGQHAIGFRQVGRRGLVDGGPLRGDADLAVLGDQLGVLAGHARRGV